MFIGQFNHNLDDKGRLVLPAKFRELLGEGAIITYGYEGCLTIYTASGFEKCVNEILSKPLASVNVRKAMRVLTANASNADIDKAGRINIPNHLLVDAGIIKEVTIIGLGSVVEVWATDRWLKEQTNDKDEFEKNSEQLYFLGEKDV